ncbi:mRNA export factor Gle1 [Anopheles ziemanni]|uniref:mRNA export factor Gle1 n=1 Tax=Anopheles coustani TaxID=139045 RepID=UPI0026588478|nr:mRNA export factor Gle1 [Anopheles coustani]XP_058173947.1 mRNA export factor Gle1 [Anopheles ziemanni]
MDSKKEFNIEDLLTGFETMKISALRNAAKLSPLIKECTLGPSCVDLSQKRPAQVADAEATKENDVNGSNESTPPRNGRSVKEVEKKSPTSSPFAGCIQSESTSCAAVTTKLHQEDLERQRQACVQKVLAERQSKIQLADKQREAQLRQSLQEAKLAVARRMQESEQRILNAVREQEQIAQEAGTRRLAEIEQENRRQSDIQAQLKRRQEDLKRKAQLIDAIRQHNAQFRSGTETFTKALTAIGVQHASKFNNQKKSIRSLQKDFEQLLQTINANHEVTQAEIDQAGEYCKQLDQVNVEVSEIILQIEASQKQQQEQLQQQQLEQQQEQQQKQEQAAQEAATQRDAASKVPDSTDGVVSAPVSLPSTLPAADDSEPIFWPVSPECLQFYNEIKSFYEQHQAAVKQLMDDPSMKTYRFNCQKAINVPVNAISAVSREHLIDKYERLAALLSGQNVKVGDATVSINGHPLGRTYCTMLMAKKFVGQGDQSISSNAAAAFPIATVIVGLWQQFPDFGRFFLAYLHRECPYLVPYYLPQHEGQSQEDYLKSLGYRFAEGGQLEKQDQYLKRMAGLARLYAAVIVTIPRIDPSKPHPHGLENGWRWLTNMLNRYPKADICATLIVEFLQTTGAFLSMTYRSQFTKLIQLLQGDYLSALSRIDQGGPKARLEGLIAQVVRDGKFDTPEGMSSLQFM